jgi:adenosylhomocysteine nucleosidase
MNVAIFSAFPQELKHIRRNISLERTRKETNCTVSTGSHGSADVILVETGMGVSQSESALLRVLQEYSPDAILSVGFAGALYEGADTGDLIWASRVIYLPEGNSESALTSHTMAFLQVPDEDNLYGALKTRMAIRSGSVVTLQRRIEKPDIKRMLPAGIPFLVCDMETYGLARVCLGRKIPFFAIRSVTDRLNEEIPDVLFNVTDKSGNYSLAKALGTIMENPDLVPDVIRLGRNSNKASKNLWQAVEILITLLNRKGHAGPDERYGT